MHLLSKIFWFFTQPVNFSMALAFLGLGLISLNKVRWGFRFAAAGLVLLLAFAHSSLPNLLVLPLENRFVRTELPGDITGFVSLGGGLDDIVAKSRSVTELESASDRLVELAVLGRRYPQAKLVYTGGTGNIIYQDGGAASVAEKLMLDLGFDASRLILEKRSRNTFENAVFTRELVKPQPGETWVLITSAFHMPRAIGTFRKAGWTVIAWPVDYRTRKDGAEWQFFFNAVTHLEIANLAVKEWIGLLAYRIAGYTDDVFPEP